MAIIEELVALLGFRTAPGSQQAVQGFQQGVQQSTQGLQALQQAAQQNAAALAQYEAASRKIGAGIGNTFDGIVSSVKRAVVGIASAALGVNLSMAGIAAAVMATTNEFDSLIKTTERIFDASKAKQGFRDLQEWGYIAKQSGGSVAGLNSEMEMLTQRMGEAARGSGRATAVLKSVGMRATMIGEDGRVRAKTATEMLDELAENFQYWDKAKQLDVASKLGLSRSMVTMLAMGSKEIRRLKNEFHEYNLMMDWDAAQGAVVFNDQLQKLSDVAMSLKNRLAMELVPWLRSYLDMFQKWYLANQKIIRQGVVQWAYDIGKAFDAIWWGTGKIITALGDLSRWLTRMGVHKGWQVAVVGGFTALLAMGNPITRWVMIVGGLLAVLTDLYAFSEGRDSLTGRMLDWAKQQPSDTFVGVLRTQFDKIKETFTNFITGTENSKTAWQKLTDAIQEDHKLPGWLNAIRLALEGLNFLLQGLIDTYTALKMVWDLRAGPEQPTRTREQMVDMLAERKRQAEERAKLGEGFVGPMPPPPKQSRWQWWGGVAKGLWEGVRPGSGAPVPPESWPAPAAPGSLTSEFSGSRRIRPGTPAEDSEPVVEAIEDQTVEQESYFTKVTDKIGELIRAIQDKDDESEGEGEKQQAAAVAAGGGGGGGGGGPGPPGSAATGPLAGRIAVAKAAMIDELAKHGVPEANREEAANLMVGQTIAESWLNPGTVHDKGTGYGIYGARDPGGKGRQRRTEMLQWLAEKGYARDSLEGQSRYMIHEAMTKYPTVAAALMSANPATRRAAMRILTYDFENPARKHDRTQHADTAAAVAANANAMTAGTGVSGGAAGTSPMVNPEVTDRLGRRAWQGGRLHPGTDWRGAAGTPFRSRFAGQVIATSPAGPGRLGSVTVRNADGSTTKYMHVVPGVAEGPVAEGQQLGVISPKDNWSTGSHLHEQMWDKNGRLVDTAALEEMRGKGLGRASWGAYGVPAQPPGAGANTPWVMPPPGAGWDNPTAVNNFGAWQAQSAGMPPWARGGSNAIINAPITINQNVTGQASAREAADAVGGALGSTLDKRDDLGGVEPQPDSQWKGAAGNIDSQYQGVEGEIGTGGSGGK